MMYRYVRILVTFRGIPRKKITSLQSQPSLERVPISMLSSLPRRAARQLRGVAAPSLRGAARPLSTAPSDAPEEEPETKKLTMVAAINDALRCHRRHPRPVLGRDRAPAPSSLLRRAAFAG